MRVFIGIIFPFSLLTTSKLGGCWALQFGASGSGFHGVSDSFKISGWGIVSRSWV